MNPILAKIPLIKSNLPIIYVIFFYIKYRVKALIVYLIFYNVLQLYVWVLHFLYIGHRICTGFIISLSIILVLIFFSQQHVNFQCLLDYTDISSSRYTIDIELQTLYHILTNQCFLYYGQLVFLLFVWIYKSWQVEYTVMKFYQRSSIFFTNRLFSFYWIIARLVQYSHRDRFLSMIFYSTSRLNIYLCFFISIFSIIYDKRRIFFIFKNWIMCNECLFKMIIYLFIMHLKLSSKIIQMIIKIILLYYTIIKSMYKEHLHLSIPNTKKPNQQFPIDPNGKLKIKYNQNQYILNQSHLNIHSSYFKQENYNPEEITIPIYFQDAIFDQVLSTLYGNYIYLDRSLIWKYYDVIVFLGIHSLLSSIRLDIAKNIESYDIFILLKMAQKQSDQKLFQLCLKQLQKYQFNQLLYSQSQLMNLDQGLFKLVIKTHNKSKNNIQKPSQYKKIILLIQSYCSVNSISQDVLEEMIFSMVDIISLSAYQFKSIFLNKKQDQVLAPQSQSIQKCFQNSPNHKHSEDRSHDSSFYDISQISQQEYYLQKLIKKNISIHKLKLENIYLRKKSSQLQALSKNFEKELSKLLAQSVYQQKTQNEIETSFKQIRCQQKLNNKNILNKYSHLIERLQQQMIKKDQRIQTLEQLCANLSLNNKKAQALLSKNFIVQSQFLPASYINQIMRQPKKIIKQHKQPKIVKINKEQIEQNYLNDLIFNMPPISISKKNYCTLGKLIGFNEFNKKRLCIIYRRSHNNNITQIGKKQVVQNRKNILFLIKTKTKQKIGFYIFSSLQKNKKVQDKHSFMFSITHNNKFRLQPHNIPDIIQIRDQQLICISNILIIPEACIQYKSLFFRSCLKNQLFKGKGSTWLEEETQFYIQHIQIFQVIQQEIQMIL